MPRPFSDETGITLSFTSNNPSDTALRGSDGTTLYAVSTEQDGSHSITTTIQRGDDEVIAVLHWHSILPDKVEGTNKDIETPQIKHCKFLRSLKHSTFEMQGKNFEWINKGADEEPVLVDVDRKRPIVLFTSPKRNIDTFEFDPPKLWCEFGVLEMLDSIVVTFLVLWKNQRTKASFGL